MEGNVQEIKNILENILYVLERIEKEEIKEEVNNEIVALQINSSVAK